MQFENIKEGPDFPLEFIRKMEEISSLDSRALLESLQDEAHIAIRHHPHKKNASFKGSNPVPWSEEGEYLDERPRFIHDPHFHAGAYYVQDAASQFLEFIYKNLPGLPEELLALDVSAAPGGKSTHLLSLMDGKGLLLANEVNRKRYQILNENLIKWGYDNYLSTSIDPARLATLGPIFDLVLLDAPCSGEGLFRKDFNARKEWSTDNVRLCEQRQRRILQEARKNIKEGGILIYSTCTFEIEENEAQVKHLIKEGFELINELVMPPPEWGIEISEECGQVLGFRFYPHLIRSEGFFVSVLRKKERSGKELRSKKASKRKVQLGEEILPKRLEPYLSVPDDRKFFNLNGKIISLFERWEALILEIIKAIPIYKTGSEMGQFKGNDFIPSHELALHALIKNRFPHLQLSREEAIRFLSRQTLNLSSPTSMGWVEMRYEESPLGWVKILPGRINNYFPTAFRIRRI